MSRLFMGRGLLAGWLLGLVLMAGAQELIVPQAETESQDSGVLLQDLIKATKKDQPFAGGDEFEPALTGETSYQAETSYDGVAISSLPIASTALPIDTTMIRVTIDDVSQFGYLAEPAGRQPIAALLLIHEWWGLTDSVKAEADHLASLGYRAFAMDLFAGQTTADRRRATALARSVKMEDTLARIDLWAQWLTHSAAQGEAQLKLGVAGWGMGANYALKYALEGSPVSALALFYGEVELDQNRLANLKCPLLGVYAGRDGWVTPQRVEKFKDALAQAHVGYSIVSYDVPSGFMLNPESLAEERSASLAKQSLEAFLARHLGNEAVVEP